MGESIAQAQNAPQAGYAGGTALSSLILGLVAVATVLLLLLFWAQPAASAAGVSTASVLSLTAFQTLTVAGVAAQLIAGYRLGRHGSPLLGMVLATPYLVLALVGPAGPEVHVLTVLLAALAPAAALAGIARRAQSIGTTGPGRPRHRPPAVTGCLACASEQRPSGAICAPVPRPAAASSSPPACPERWRQLGERPIFAGSDRRGGRS